MNEVLGDLRHEAGPRLTADWSPNRVALIAQWSREAVPSRSLHELISQLVRAGFKTVVISACEAPEPLRWVHGLPPRTTVLRRPNLGHDFGSWAAALARLPQVVRAPRVILTNDSMVGPFRSLQWELRLMERHPVDVWGMTTGTQVLPHLQTFFLYFRDGVLCDRPLRDFWARVRPHETKWETVVANELGLAQLMSRERYTWGSAYSAPAPGEPNRSMAGWESLLDDGFPFVKRMLVADERYRHERFVVTRSTIAERVRRQFGVELEEWI